MGRSGLSQAPPIAGLPLDCPLNEAALISRESLVGKLTPGVRSETRAGKTALPRTPKPAPAAE